MLERTIELTVTGNALNPSSTNAGYAGEHLATRLQFILPEEWTSDPALRYYVAYQSADGKRYCTDYLAAPVETYLCLALMIEGPLTVQLNAVSENPDGEITIMKSASCQLTVKVSIGDTTNIYDGLLEKSIFDFDAKVKDLEDIIGTVKLGGEHIENVQNPHQVTAQQTGAVPMSRTINGKALTENITLASADVNARPDDWLPSPDQIGAATAEQGAKADAAISQSEKGAPNGVAALTDGGKLAQMPSASDVGAEITTGSNENGSWIKFQNGILLQYGNYEGITSESGTMTITYPIPFVGTTPRPLATPVYSYFKNISLVYSAPTLTDFRVYIVKMDGTQYANLDQKVSWMCIGKWK